MGMCEGYKTSVVCYIDDPCQPFFQAKLTFEIRFVDRCFQSYVLGDGTVTLITHRHTLTLIMFSDIAEARAGILAPPSLAAQSRS